MTLPKLNFILFDLIGTTVQDTSQQGNSLIINCFIKAFNKQGIHIESSLIQQERGKLKRTAIQNIMQHLNIEASHSELIYADFIASLNANINQFSAMPRAEDVFEYLKNQDIKIGIGSGLPLNFINQLIDHLGWSQSQFDYIASSDTLGKSRPDPIMILDAMNQLNISDPQTVLKIGDTVVDIQEGKNAAVHTAGVLTGTTTREQFSKQGADFMLQSIEDLLNYL